MNERFAKLRPHFGGTDGSFIGSNIFYFPYIHMTNNLVYKYIYSWY